MQFHQTKLANGLQIIGETNPSVRSVALGFFVKTGSRDETPDLAGVSHYLEHMVFKGTPRRTALQVNRDFDDIGANYNAYTSEENTVFYAAILPEYLPQVVDVLADVLRPSLRSEDFDMEKKVILEEIGMYEDQPMWSTYDHARKHYFGEHPLGNSVLGSTASVSALTREQMRDYFDLRYVAPNITAVAAGNFDWKHFCGLIDQACENWPTGSNVRHGISAARGPKSTQVIRKEKVAQEHVVMISPGPATDSPLRYAADTLALAIGDDTGSRFYWALVDPGHVDSADISFNDYEGTGSFYTSISGEPAKAAANLEIARKILRQVQKEGITAQELHTAKSKIGSRVVRSSERPMGRMQSLGMALTYLGQYRSVDAELAAFEAVTLDSIREVLDAFPVDEVTTLALGPLETLG